MRTVEVVPPGRSSEAVNVALCVAAIATVALYVIVFRGGGPRSESSAQDLLPFQVSFQDLPGPEQRMVRELVEAFDESRRLRSADGEWPAAGQLATQGVPPFAADALDQAGYRWSFRQKDLVVNYEGIPRDPSSPDFLLLIQEPPPAGGEVPVPGVADEEHQLLPDGRLLHVTWWKRKHKGEDARLVVQPAAEGWTQIRLRRPQEPAR